MSVKVKICGLMQPEDTLAALEADADFVGVVFAESKRRQTVESARKVLAPIEKRGGLPFWLTVTEGYPPQEWYFQAAQRLEHTLQGKRPLVVGVFQDQTPEEINRIAEEVELDMVQIGGEDPWEMTSDLHTHTIKTVRGGSASFGEVRIGPYLCLLDSQDSGRGQTFPWDRATRLALQMPLMLAGGLNADNVREAIQKVRPWAVDVSSGVEREGRKDPQLIKEFVRRVREAA
ncbi:MAG: phosphoribosylanthranilate isomerase [Dehalococcoidia bacterium]